MGAVAAGGTLGILIPPSIMLVFYAGETGLSAARLFSAAFGPGLLLSGLYCLYVFFRCLINPKMAPMIPKENLEKLTVRDIFRLIKGLCPVLGLILAVLGAIIGGIATPTEAAGTGAIGAMLVAQLYRKLSFKLLWDAGIRTVQSMGMIMLLIITAGCFANVFTGMGGDELVLEAIGSTGIGQIGVIIICLIIVAIFGMFIDWAGILYICLPIFMPLVMEYDINPLWFALLVCTTLQTAWLTPPFGFSIFFVKSVVPQDITYNDIVKGCLPYFAMQIIGVILCVMFPQIILWIPKIMRL
jgi:tripartite ATP-independent transporter DctM subunit